MDYTNQYKGLTEKEVREFLSDLEEADDELRDFQDEADRNLADKALQDSSRELPENNELEAMYGNDAWRKLGRNTTILFDADLKRKRNLSLVKANKKRAQSLREARIDIQRRAFDQTDLNLKDPLDRSKIKLLIDILVSDHTKMIDKYEQYINKRLTSLLNPLIPRKLRSCWNEFRDSIKACPGFLYRASEDYGNGLTFWATPDIPYYFRQNTEQDVLLKNNPDLLIKIDRTILLRQEHVNKRAEKELKYASMFIQRSVSSYFDLLKMNPFWFDTLYQYLKSTNSI